MRAIVLYDSVFGNTQEIAESIANALGSVAEVELLRPSDSPTLRLAGLDLLVVGSPTRGFRPTDALSGVLKRIPPNGLRQTRVAAFDTRFKADELQSATTRSVVKTGGYAAKRIASQLQKVGGNLVALPERFYVEDTEGPLKPGEIERAAAWAATLIHHPPAPRSD